MTGRMVNIEAKFIVCAELSGFESHNVIVVTAEQVSNFMHQSERTDSMPELNNCHHLEMLTWVGRLMSLVLGWYITLQISYETST